MRTGTGLAAFVLAAAISFVPVTTRSAIAQDSPSSPVEALEGNVAGISYFYDALNEDGGWFEHPRLGFVWQPDVDGDWRPYTVGRWVNSDTYGWTWLSDEPFGWAVYHYGRWTRDHEFGWVWVPGTEWAPAWVLWRFNDEAIGWAPMPPEARFERGRVFADPSFYESRAFLPRWVFASPRSFTRAGVHRYVRPVSWNRELLGRTRARVSYDLQDKRLVHRGIPADEIEKLLRGPVPRAKIAPVDEDAVRQRQVSRETARLDGKSPDGNLGDVQIYRPERARTQSIVSTNPTPRAAGKPKLRGGTEFGRLSKERRERSERETRETSDDMRRPRNSEEALREYNESPGARSSVEGDDAGRDSDGSYRPWKNPDGTTRRSSDPSEAQRKVSRPADEDDASPPSTPERRRTAAPDDASDRSSDDAPADNANDRGGDRDASLPVDDPAPAPRKPKSRDAGLSPETMPEPELIDPPAKGKKSSKPVEFYERLPADPEADAAPEGSSRPAPRPTDSGRGGGRFGNVTPYSPPEDYSAPPPATVADPSSPPDDRRKTEPAAKSKTKPAEGGTEKTKATPAEKTETGTNPPPRKRAGAADSPAGPEDAAASGEESAKPKSKRRWDQNGSSGYPTVIGPDGKPVQ